MDPKYKSSDAKEVQGITHGRTWKDSNNMWHHYGAHGKKQDICDSLLPMEQPVELVREASCMLP